MAEAQVTWKLSPREARDVRAALIKWTGDARDALRLTAHEGGPEKADRQGLRVQIATVESVLEKV